VISDPLFLGVDLGTSSLKCGIFDLGGRRIADARVPYPTKPTPQGLEQQADDWWRAFAGGIRQVVAETPPKRIAAIAIGGHAPSPALVDASLNAVAPVMPWLDVRSRGQIDELTTSIGRPPLSGPERLAMQLAGRAMWLRQKAPESFARAAYILHSGDYLVARAIGSPVTTSPNLPEIFEAAGLSAKLLPEIELTAGEVAGTLSPVAADQLGLAPQTRVIAAGLDSFLAAIGSGIAKEGECCLAVGTSSGVAMLTDAPIGARFEWCGHRLLSKRIHLGGRLLEWLTDANEAGFPELFRSAANLPVPLRSQPHLPQLLDDSADDARLQSCLSEIAPQYDRAEVFRLVLDSVFLCQRLVVRDFQNYAGRVRRFVSVGALAADPELDQLQADVFGCSVEVPEYTESGALGAAILAAIAMTPYTPQQACARMVRIRRTWAPRSEVAAYYRQLRNTVATP
jgi:xylulokinase